MGGTGFIGTHIVCQIAGQGHCVAVYHRGMTRATLPRDVQQIVNPLSIMPIQVFPPELFQFQPDVVILTIAMGADDARAAMEAFAGYTGRIVQLSSGDVYRAYGRFTQIEPGPIETGLLTEDSPLRSVLFPYRSKAPSPQALEYWYEKILAERAVLNHPSLPAAVLRLPKVYGPEGNANLATVYANRHHPGWRWTHGYVENVAAAVTLAALHPAAGGRTYNVGEAYTPTIAERLASLPPSDLAPDLDSPFDFSQDIAYDTSRIRAELGYREIVPEEEGVQRTLASVSDRLTRPAE
jgi:nucleoside-diphosphate-sugar epimerase